MFALVDYCLGPLEIVVTLKGVYNIVQIEIKRFINHVKALWGGRGGGNFQRAKNQLTIFELKQAIHPLN